MGRHIVELPAKDFETAYILYASHGNETDKELRVITCWYADQEMSDVFYRVIDHGVSFDFRDGLRSAIKKYNQCI
jgi:hypothetical protein